MSFGIGGAFSGGGGSNNNVGLLLLLVSVGDLEDDGAGNDLGMEGGGKSGRDL